MPNGNPLLGFMQCTFDLIWQADKCDFGRVRVHSNAPTPFVTQNMSDWGEELVIKRLESAFQALATAEHF